MKKILNLTAILATLILAFACKKTEVIELTVSPLSVSFEAAGGDQSVAISCNDAWTVSKNADWLSVSADKGNGNAALKITATENKGLETREADVTVAAGEIKRVVRVTQLGKKPVLTVSPDALNATDEGGELELTVTSNVEWTLTIPEDAAWALCAIAVSRVRVDIVGRAQFTRIVLVVILVADVDVNDTIILQLMLFVVQAQQFVFQLQFRNQVIGTLVILCQVSTGQWISQSLLVVEFRSTACSRLQHVIVIVRGNAVLVLVVG